MSRTLGAVSIRHRAGKCPACHDYLWADVLVEVTVSDPTLDEAGKPSVYATPLNVAASIVAHECDQREQE